jgi:hypothetical protein
MITRDDFLASLGLQPRTTVRDYFLAGLGVFGSGMLVGGALGLLFAPKPGMQLRGDIGRQAKQFANTSKQRLRRGKETNGSERHDPYEQGHGAGSDPSMIHQEH